MGVATLLLKYILLGGMMHPNHRLDKVNKVNFILVGFEPVNL